MNEELLERVLSEAQKRVNDSAPVPSSQKVHLTEFVGTAMGDTIGMVIANIDMQLHEHLGLDKKYRSIGFLSARTGGAPHIMSADEAVKATNTEIVKIEMARDTKGGAGHGATIIFAAEDVSDARRAVEITLASVERNFGNVYGNDAGHIELHYTARASQALEMGFTAPVGKSFGIIVGAPAAIGLLMADTAVKTANVNIVTFASPDQGTARSNEIIVTITGDSGAVKQALLSAQEVGLASLEALGGAAPSSSTPTLF
ncbi:microcompartment protein PduB [Enterococcus florum]|uniref:Microcompartment protein PduB n=1 Tax=Enterococcus florum TaxID=2480627 RepID=A0A4P5P5L2_9ENTE|nr:propanediol utilization microcompartment protein PduB [Enterococcus florum]GCF93125.1 microcompartment protein PduB [Enterococcus florum]